MDNEKLQEDIDKSIEKSIAKVEKTKEKIADAKEAIADAKEAIEKAKEDKKIAEDKGQEKKVEKAQEKIDAHKEDLEKAKGKLEKQKERLKEIKEEIKAFREFRRKQKADNDEKEKGLSEEEKKAFRKLRDNQTEGNDAVEVALRNEYIKIQKDLGMFDDVFDEVFNDDRDVELQVVTKRGKSREFKAEDIKIEKEAVELAIGIHSAPLGLFGAGICTILINLHNAGFLPMSNVIIVMGIFYGGLAQIIAGNMEAKEGNTYGFTAFTAYGMFWLGLMSMILLKEHHIMSLSENADGAYLMVWAAFSLVFAIPTLGGKWIDQGIFFTITALLFCLAMGHFTGNKTWTHTGGWIGIINGFIAFYAGLEIIIENKYDKFKFQQDRERRVLFSQVMKLTANKIRGKTNIKNRYKKEDYLR